MSNEEEPTSDLEYIQELGLASSDSTLGKLQRGRGAGWLEVLELPVETAREYVWQCIAYDPRISSQGDSRIEYYARLAELTGLDPTRLRPSQLPPTTDEWRRWLVVQVLSRLDDIGVPEAGTALLEHVASGIAWDDAIAELSRSQTATRDGLPSILIERFDHAKLTWLVGRYDGSHPWDDGLPWKEWSSEYPEIRRAVAVREVKPPRSARVAPSVQLPVAELLKYHWPLKLPPELIQRLRQELRAGEREAIIEGCDAPGTRCIMPFMFLGCLNDPFRLDAALAVLDSGEPGGRRSGARRYIEALGPEHTLAVARERLPAGDESGVGGTILALHAEAEDVGLARRHLAEAWEARQFFALVDMLHALQRNPEQGPFEELRRLFEEIEYSYARDVTVETMAASDPEFTERFARECMWDSEPRIQELGAEYVTATDEQAIERRRHIVEYEGTLPG